jgi:hypothetical protein
VRISARRLRLADRAVDEHRRHQLRREVPPPVLQRFRDRAEPRHGVPDERRLRAQAVKEETEDALEAEADVDLGLAPPRFPLGHDRPAGEDRHDEVAIDPLVGPERGLGHRAEAVPPGRAPLAPRLERRGREIVEAPVELGKAVAARHDRRRLVLLREELPAERAERGQTLTSQQFRRSGRTPAADENCLEVKV